MIQHLIYDFDGTIADSYPIFVRIMHDVADELGFAITCDDDVLYRSLKVTLRTAYDLMQIEHLFSFQTVMSSYHKWQAAYAKEFKIYPQARELLLLAKKKGRHNYIYTHTGPVVKDLLANRGVLDLFDFVLDSSYGFPMKPAPDALRFLLDRFQLDPKECMMIGDRPIDAYAGMRAGMLGCLWDEDSLFTDAKVDYYIRRLEEVKTIVAI